jgi:hypothetical protein
MARRSRKDAVYGVDSKGFKRSGSKKWTRGRKNRVNKGAFGSAGHNSKLLTKGIELLREQWSKGKSVSPGAKWPLVEAALYH